MFHNNVNSGHESLHALQISFLKFVIQLFFNQCANRNNNIFVTIYISNTLCVWGHSAFWREKMWLFCWWTITVIETNWLKGFFNQCKLSNYFIGFLFCSVTICDCWLYFPVISCWTKPNYSRLHSTFTFTVIFFSNKDRIYINLRPSRMFPLYLKCIQKYQYQCHAILALVLIFFSIYIIIYYNFQYMCIYFLFYIL